MPSGKRLLEDFILPALNAETYGQFLEWVDPQQRKSFKVLYHHKNGHNWSENSADVFVAWDKLKGRTRDTEDYFTKSRQRFRVALAKCPRLEKLPPCGNKHVEIFRILSHKKMKQKPDPSLKSHLPNVTYKRVKGNGLDTFSIPETIDFSRNSVPVIQSVITLRRHPPTSVIVSPEDVRQQQQQQQRLSLAGTPLKLEIKQEPDVSRKSEKDVDDQIVPTSVLETAKGLSHSGSDVFFPPAPAPVPPRVVHRMPVVPIPERTPGIEVLKSKPKPYTQLPHVIRYSSCHPGSQTPVDHTASSTEKIPYASTPPGLQTQPEKTQSTVSNLSLLNIQSVQRLK